MTAKFFLLSWTAALLLLVLSADARGQAGERPVRRPARPRVAPPAGILTHVPSRAAGKEGVAVRVLAPRVPRYEEGAPVVIHVAGGVRAGRAVGRPEFTGLGFVEIFFAFPGGGDGEARSGGAYDFRGPASVRALADVIRFATGRVADTEGRDIDALVEGVDVLTTDCGLIGSSHGGNACGVAMGLFGEEFPDLAFYASMESPYGEGAANVELGGHETGVNPAYDPETGVLDLSCLAWSPELSPGFFRRGNRPGVDLRGALYFDIDRDGKFTRQGDFMAHVFARDVGSGVKAYYSPRLIREAERRSLFGEARPDHLPTLLEAEEFWRYRDGTGSIPEAVRKCPKLAVIVYAGERDHVQAAPDHPHILTQVEGFRRAGAHFVRLNPDRSYARRIALAAGGRPATDRPFADNDAGEPVGRKTIRARLEPAGLPPAVFMQAAVCELADRVKAGNRSSNLDSVLYPDAPWEIPRPRSPGRRPRDERPEAEPREKPLPPGPREAPERGTRRLGVDAAKPAGKIRSLLGVNRGPISYPRRPGERSVSHVESYRALGIDFIRTHDFYGPTDWYVIFPDWSADPEDPAAYDFRSSDERIRAIAENGFRCFYRLGTSWKGRRDSRPMINDPPGTLRDRRGRVVHRADRDDFRKWAKVCVQTVRHYTEGWNGGFEYPIEYWEIWNEPDLAAQFWTGTPEQYYVMYEEAARAIKALNPELKVGGPACTGGLREAFVEGFIRYCRDHEVPLDFFSWHSYGGRGGFNPHRYHEDAVRIRKTLDRYGFTETENINSEWNAGTRNRQFSDTPAGAAYYASTLVSMLDAGIDHAFQYCGDNQPRLGLHDFHTGEPKICGKAFAAWKRLLSTPERVEARGGDERGYTIVAGKDSAGTRVRILVSDFQSGDDAFLLDVNGLPWEEDTPFLVRLRFLVGRRAGETEEIAGVGREIAVHARFGSGSVCLVEIDRRGKR